MEKACLVNPTLGREKEMALVPTRKPKKIMVVGGGATGVESDNFQCYQVRNPDT